jgi:hypothetical protein
MDHACGFDGGDNYRPSCGQLATLHLMAGEPPATIGEYAMLACDGHAETAKKLAIDWHPVASVCGVPDSGWHFKSEQGKGFCFWPEAEALIQEAVREPAHVVEDNQRKES